MYSKLSFRNMKRSISDYAIYFVTLMLAVCLFYTFNSLSAQQVMLELSNMQAENMSTLNNLITLASVIISGIFCILCVFANEFLIKRRKKEFGLYMSLGMGKGSVSKILIIETLLIGVLSLIVGIGVGVFVSQGMSIFTASLFNITLTGYKFVFSFDAMVKTAIFFGLVFVLVMIFNVIAVSKYTLIELLTTSQKGEKQRIKSPIINGLLAAMSIVLVVSGYIRLLNVNILEGFIKAGVAVALMSIGTLLFYLFGISFLLSLMLKCKKFSYKEINLFNIKQMKSKINSASITLATTSLLLFFTISILANGISYKTTMEKELELVTPFDVSISVYNSDKLKDFDIDTLLLDKGIDISNGQNVILEVYDTGINGNELLKPYAMGKIKQDIEEGFPLNTVAISYSDYLELMKLQGKTPVTLDKNQTIIITNMNEAQQTIQNLTNNLKSYTVGNNTLSLSEQKYQLGAIETETVGRTIACFVVSDEVASELESFKTIVNMQYKVYNSGIDNEFQKSFDKLLSDSSLSDNRFYASGITKTTAIQEVTGYTTNLLYVGIYLGIVFLVTCGAVLGLRLLSDASDEKDRYKIIERIGATDKMINKSVLSQVMLYFIAPLLLAVPNALIVSAFITKQLSSTAVTTSVLPALFTAATITVLYGAYFVISLSGYKGIVKK